ncbi:5647_t:CDS:2 [Cetraspora pellucida]|uniref:5647_t:CDS:1 n=1 Tax=Cetraspora pellucida TaxID=1433469 RepID=A0ACA9KJJ5_9GLOM|nr:5647_t:CDS:2 [Cetraspora pellucida]
MPTLRTLRTPRLRSNRDNGHNNIRRARERRRNNPPTLRTVDPSEFPPEFNQVGALDMCEKGNDMELFHFLTAGPYTINRAPNILEKNIECIKDLILRMKLVSFPPRPLSNQFSSYQIQDLVYLWKKISYNEICDGFNVLIMQGALLLFPPTPSAKWIRPDVKTINA